MFVNWVNLQSLLLTAITGRFNVTIKKRSFLIPVAAAIGAIATPGVQAAVDHQTNSISTAAALPSNAIPKESPENRFMSYAKGNELHGLILAKNDAGVVLAYHSSHRSHSSHSSHSSHYSRTR